ncbi:formimidoylglutamase [Flavobacterium agricola]|uniref:Formimidoylglutamase n=1 Tax=Flavobacterium agricola TaxID=2870839 RepID=A0ABY6M3Q5_9FLAO|nr:formimidoylglutamase [Flavobacterium agricola]UYW02140.1 formimidoylglutamase [Flavobacterium agricola]
MSYFSTFTPAKLNKQTKFRNSEIKLGERTALPKDNENIEQFIATTDAVFIVFGIEEDLGVIANNGIPGTNKAWEIFTQTFLNIQNNNYLKGKNIALLGSFDFSELVANYNNTNLKDADSLHNLYEMIALIDKEVSYLVSKIIEAKKIPIIIGGGHNNAYGNIKGLSLALGKSVNAVNFDAHTDFRNLEGRHSGNGFSYAYDHCFLKKYFIFGAHENYLSKSILKNIEATQGNVMFNTYEEIMVREEKSFKKELLTALNHVNNTSFGVEVDMDAIVGIPASAQTPSGFSMEKARQFVHFFGSQKNAAYLHICEAAPALAQPNQVGQVGKAITYLVTDFIKAKIELLDN